MFNSFIPYQGKILGFNAWSDSYVLMEEHLWKDLDAARKSGSFERLAEEAPAMVQGLVDNGFLVPAGKDELAEVKAVSRSVDNDDSLYHIILNPTMSCNFSCWYCYETHEKKSHVSGNSLERITRHISRACEIPPEPEGASSVLVRRRAPDAVPPDDRSRFRTLPGCRGSP